MDEIAQKKLEEEREGRREGEREVGRDRERESLGPATFACACHLPATWPARGAINR